MPRRVSLVVLHEDSLHESFASAFLNASNLPTRGRPRTVRGESRAGVVSKFATEARAMLQSGGETHLIVMVDSDGWSYEDVRRQLLDTLDDATRQRIEANERWLIVNPAWELENWVHRLQGRNVTEARNLGLTLDRDKDCRPAARTLAMYCQRGEEPPNTLPSLTEACVRWRRYIERNDL